MNIRLGRGPEPLVVFTSLIVAAGVAISFVAVIVLRGLYRGQR